MKAIGLPPDARTCLRAHQLRTLLPRVVKGLIAGDRPPERCWGLAKAGGSVIATCAAAKEEKGKKKMGKTSKESPILPLAGTKPAPPPKRGYVPGQQQWERLGCMDAAVARPSCSARRISSMTGREKTATTRRSKAVVARRGSCPFPPLFRNVSGMRRGHVRDGRRWWTYCGGGRHPTFRPLKST